MDLEKVKLIFADLDDTLSELYKPASKKVKEYLNRLLQEGKSIVIISGQGRDNIYDRVVCGIEENLRRKILVCGCGGAYIYGFDNDGKFEKNPIYSIYEEKLNIEQRKVWREKISRLIKEFDLKLYKSMPKDEFTTLTNSMPVSTMVEVNGFVRKGSKIEIEVTAILEK